MHTIRLRHPWQCETVDGSSVWLRKFNWPTELSDGEVVQLVIEPLDLATAIALNDEPLVSENQQPLLVTHLLRPHNRLAITCPCSTSASAPPSEQCPFDVRLEIVPR